MGEKMDGPMIKKIKPLTNSQPLDALDIIPNVVDKSMGQKATMRWDVNNAVQVVIQPGFGEVQHQGTKIVNPPALGVHTYTLITSNGAGTITRTQTLTVKP